MSRAKKYPQMAARESGWQKKKLLRRVVRERMKAEWEKKQRNKS
jgi:hypothetical protein